MRKILFLVEGTVKINWNQKYTTIAIYSYIVIISSIVFYLIVSGLDKFTDALQGYISILYPFIYGFIIAYLVNFLLVFFIKHLIKIPVMKKMKKSKFHKIALLFAYIVSGFFVYLFIAFILPQLVASIKGLANKLPDYIVSTNDYIKNLSNNVDLPKEVDSFINERWDELAVFINNFAGELIPKVFSILRSTALSVWNVILGIIISIYMLAEKDQFISLAKKINFALFNKKIADKIIQIIRKAHKLFSGFLIGKILDSLIVGLIAFIVLSIVNMPYTLLITFIITITNIIPFFGPFIGAIPSGIIIFFESPVMALWFALIILLLQQLDGNYIGPKILGDTLGISSFWILFAILVGGKFFGITGLIIGVPLFVLVYSIVKEIIEAKLKAKGLPIDTKDYLGK
ncbi:MAG: putative permease [Clostridiales bacterium]|jgi:predicted PurR-regulated permease PerM|nr:putative permease [Clostridiales bacterium]